MKNVLQDAALIALPPILHSTAFGLISQTMPSRTTVRVSMLSLEVALILLSQARNHEEWIRFGWADSSPQVNFDWLLSAYDEIHRSNLRPAFRAAQAAIRANPDRLSWGNIGPVYTCRYWRSAKKWRDGRGGGGKGDSGWETEGK